MEKKKIYANTGAPRELMVIQTNQRLRLCNISLINFAFHFTETFGGLPIITHEWMRG